MKRRDRIRLNKLQLQAEGYLELGMAQHALDSLARIGDSANFNSHTLYLWGESLRSLERFHEALLPLQRASATEPENIHIWLAIGWCYKRTGQIELAIESLEKAITTDPNEPLLHYNLACYLSLAGDKGRMLDHLQTALTINPLYRCLVDDEPDFDPVRSDPDFQALTSISV